MKRIRVLVVEDQKAILHSQIKVFRAFPEIEVVGKALTGEAALVEVERVKPDAVLLDLGLPGISGIEVTRQVKARWPEIEVLIFTVFEEEEKVIEAIRAGASGYLLKGSSAGDVVGALREVVSGGSVIQPSLARRLLRHFQAPELRQEDRPALTAREQEILLLIAKGLTNPEAAEVLGISRATIRTHLEHIYDKLDVTGRVEAVTEGIRQGIIEV